MDFKQKLMGTIQYTRKARQLLTQRTNWLSTCCEYTRPFSKIVFNQLETKIVYLPTNIKVQALHYRSEV